LSSRYFATAAASPPVRTLRLAQRTNSAIGVAEIRAVAPYPCQPVDDRAPIACGAAAIRSIDGLANQGGDGRPAPPALGRQHAGALLVEVQLRPTHVTMYDIH